MRFAAGTKRLLMSASQFPDRRIIYGASARVRSINLEKRFQDQTAAADKADICPFPLATPSRDGIGLDWRRLHVPRKSKHKGAWHQLRLQLWIPAEGKLNGNLPTTPRWPPISPPCPPLASTLLCIFSYSYSPFPFECTLKTFVVVVTFGPLMLSCL